MVIGRATPETEAGKMPSPEQFAAMGDFNRQLMEAGILEDGAGLKPSSAGRQVHFDGGETTVTDGPFMETREIIAGYSLWNVQDMDEAVAWAKKCPMFSDDPCMIEIRPMYGPEDFAAVA
jgi:hypothetical protein